MGGAVTRKDPRADCGPDLAATTGVERGAPSLPELRRPELSLVVPIYDEEETLVRTFARLTQALERTGLEFEIVGVDDGSRDESARVLYGLAHRDSRVVVLRNRNNEGKGSAVQKGVLAARGRWIATLDADLSTDLDALPRGLELLRGGAAVVLGDRHRPGAEVLVRQPRVRGLCGRVFSFLGRRLVAPSVSDFTCGFKAFRRDAARTIFSGLETPGWAFDLEVVAVAQSRGLSIAPLPVRWSNRSATRVRLPGDAWRALVDLLRIATHYRAGLYREGRGAPRARGNPGAQERSGTTASAPETGGRRSDSTGLP